MCITLIIPCTVHTVLYLVDWEIAVLQGFFPRKSSSPIDVICLSLTNAIKGGIQEYHSYSIIYEHFSWIQNFLPNIHGYFA